MCDIALMLDSELGSESKIVEGIQREQQRLDDAVLYIQENWYRDGCTKMRKGVFIVKVRSLCCKVARGQHSNIFCTPIFVLGQDESQGTTTEKSGWSKVKLPFGWTRVNLAFYLEYRYYTS